MDYNHPHPNNNNNNNNGAITKEGSLSNTSSSSDLNQSSSTNSISHSNSNNNSNTNFQQRHPNNNNNNNNNKNQKQDPMQSWWESVSQARTRIQSLLSLLPPSYDETLSSLADSDRPARSLLDSNAAYTAVSSSITGSGDDPLCQWLYDTFQRSDDNDDSSDLRLVVMSFVPLLAGLYLSRIHAISTTTPTPGSPSLAGFEAVLLALYSSQTKSRSGKPILVSIPNPAYLSHNSSLYHHLPPPNKSSPPPPPSASISLGVLCPPLEPQVGIKSTKRASIIGVAFNCFYAHISHMPSWSKIEVCRFAASWAGYHCPCSLSQSDLVNGDVDAIYSPNQLLNGEISVSQETEMSMALTTVINDSLSDGDGVRIPLAWEVLQPMLRILGHCLMAPVPLISDEIKDAASLAVSRLYARASHDLSPQAILATRALFQLHNRAIAAANAALLANASSNATTPTSMKRPPEMLLVSK